MGRVLFIQPAFLGDAILATAMLEAWHARYPTSRVDVLVRRGNEGLFEGHPFVGRVWVWDKSRGHKFRDWWRILNGIRSQRYDTIVNAHRFLSSGAWTGLGGAPMRVGFAANPFSWSFQRRHVHRTDSGEHEVERNHALISEWVGEVPGAPRLYPRDEDRQWAADWIPEGAILLAPASQWHTKQWPVEAWQNLLQILHVQHPDWPVGLMGGKGDRELLEGLASSTGHPLVRIAAGAQLLQIAAAMERAALVVSNDSAPMHFASAMQTPTVALYLSTVPGFGFGPRAPRSLILEPGPELSCRPCGLHGHRTCPLGHFSCSRAVGPDAVLRAIEAIR